MTKSSFQTKQEKNPSNNEALSFLEEGAIADWLITNGKYIVYVLGALLVLFLIFFKFSSSHTRESEQDYLQATSDFTTVLKAENINTPQAEAALKQLQGLINSHPELLALYDGTIAQLYLNNSQLDKALPLAEATLKRTKSDDVPFYHDYAETTLLISAEKYQEALKNAIALQDKMTQSIKDKADQPLPFKEELFALNLFRIAMLQQQLNDQTGELQSWQQWKQYAGLGQGKNPLPVHVAPLVFRGIIQKLAIGDVSLPDYISYRENILLSKAK